MPLTCHFQLGHRCDVGRPSRGGCAHAGYGGADPARGDGQRHVLEHGPGGEAGPRVEGVRVKVHRAGDQPYRLALAVGQVRDERQQPAGDAPAEVVGVDVHDPQRDVRLARVVEARPREPAGGRVLGQHAAAGVERLVHVAEERRRGRAAGKTAGLPWDWYQALVETRIRSATSERSASRIGRSLMSLLVTAPPVRRRRATPPRRAPGRSAQRTPPARFGKWEGGGNGAGDRLRERDQ